MERMGQIINHGNCFTYAGGGEPILEYEYMYVYFRMLGKNMQVTYQITNHCLLL